MNVVAIHSGCGAWARRNGLGSRCQGRRRPAFRPSSSLTSGPGNADSHSITPISNNAKFAAKFRSLRNLQFRLRAKMRSPGFSVPAWTKKRKTPLVKEFNWGEGGETIGSNSVANAEMAFHLQSSAAARRTSCWSRWRASLSSTEGN